MGRTARARTALRKTQKALPGIRLGLERVRRVLAALGHPEEEFASILLAGTNGKGSVSAMLESALRAAGHRTGLYTSPHLISPTERVRVNGRPIPAAAQGALLRRVFSAARRCKTRLTEFEAQTLAAFLYFAQRRVDIAVVEVGLGGRLDATNALPAPEATVITSIGHDHQAWLGSTLREIYHEKAGVVRPDAIHVEAVPRTLARSGTPFHAQNPSVKRLGEAITVKPVRTDWRNGRQHFDVLVDGARYRKLRIGLMGAHQLENAALAVAVLHGLKRRGWRLPDAALRSGLAAARWSGRFQIVRGKPPVILDGAHNPEGMTTLTTSYAMSPWKDRAATVIFGCLKDKDAEGLARILSPWAQRVLTVDLPTERARRASELRDIWAPRAPATACGSFNEAWALARQDGSPVLVTGSLYLVGEALKSLKAAA